VGAQERLDGRPKTAGPTGAYVRRASFTRPYSLLATAARQVYLIMQCCDDLGIGWYLIDQLTNFFMELRRIQLETGRIMRFAIGPPASCQWEI